MAICHYSVGHVSRSTGSSSVFSAAYITGEKLHDDRLDKSKSYSNKEEIVDSGTLIPTWANAKFKDTQYAWNAFEKHADKFAESYYKTKETQDKFKQSAQIGMKVILALPKDLSEEVNKELMHDFMQQHFISKGHVVTYGIHMNEGNPHGHLLVSHWKIEEDQSISRFKNSQLYSRNGLKQQRENWANTVNHYLEREGLEVRIDHRSYKDQGIDLIPTTHEGWYARKLEREGIESKICSENRAIKEENMERVAQYPEIILKELTAQKATYSELDILKTVEKRTLDHPDIAQHVFESVLDKSIPIGHGFDSQPRFTSPEYHEKENIALEDFKHLALRNCENKISSSVIDNYISEFRSKEEKMSEEQEKAVRSLCSDSGFGVLIGRAGTGKTTSVLAPVVDLYTAAGYKVMGMALAAEAAQNLSKETGCEAETIAYYTYRWNEIEKAKLALESGTLTNKERHKLEIKLEKYKNSLPTKDTVIIVDEAGMVGTVQLQQISEMAIRTGAKLILCGDDHQYKAIDAGDIFRKAIEGASKAGCMAELTKIFRQNIDWMREASMQLSQLEGARALVAYENRGHVRELDTKDDMIREISSLYLEKALNKPEESGCVLTSTNDVRLNLNAVIRKGLQAKGLLGKDVIEHQGKGFAIGEKIIFLENDRTQWNVKSKSGKFAVKNGTRGTIESIEAITQKVSFKDDKGKKTTKDIATHKFTVHVGGKEKVKFTLHDYKDFDHAYAVTGHKSQGQTVDWSMVHLSKRLDAYGLYVMLTRHREDITLYHNREEFESFNNVIDSIRVGYKDLAIDYTINPENHEYFFNVEDYKVLGREIMQGIRAGTRVDDLLKERKDLARTIVEEKDAHKLFVMQAGLTFEKLEITAGLKARPLTLIEQKAQATVEQYALMATEARELWRDIRKTSPGSLAKIHPEYPKFEELRQERGSLANLIMEAPILHRPFLKDVMKDLGYGVTTIQKQAEAFQSKQLLHTLQRDGLDLETSQKLQVLSSYVEARDQFGQLWQDLRPQLKAAEGTLLKPTLNDQIQHLRDSSIQRDKLAYQIVENLESYQGLAKSIQVTLDLNKLFNQAENGLRQSCIEQYKDSDSQLVRSMAAYELNELWTHEKTAGLKTTVRDLLQNKIDLLELRATAYQFERTQIYISLGSDQERQTFKDLEHYQELKQATNDHYKLCVEDAKEKAINPWESSYYAAFSSVSAERDAAANNLIKQPYGEVSSLAQKMSVSLKTLDQEAHRDYLRQTSETYLSGMGSKSIYAAKELQAWLDFDRETDSKQTVGIMAEMKYLPKDLVQHLKESEAKALNKAIGTRNSEVHASSHTQQYDKPPSIHDSLKERMPDLVQDLLGNPSSRSGIQWRFGRKGSISVTVNGSQKGLYSNFETGTHGGPLKMIEETFNVSKDGALEWAKNWLGQTHERLPVYKQAPLKETKWTPVLPVPENTSRPEPQKDHYLSYMLKEREIKTVFPYRNEEGQLLGYVVRLEDKDGSKITPTLTYCQNEQGQQHWRWKGFEGVRPLYGLDRLEKDKPVLLVEGEKAADAAQKLLPDYAVLSWPGGAGAVSKANWSPLVGKDVTIWPDNDAPGLKAADKITEILGQLNVLQGDKGHLKVVDLPKDLPESWDLADKLPETLTINKVKILIENSPALTQEPEKGLSWKEALEQTMRVQKENRIRQATGKSLEKFEQIRNEFLQTFKSSTISTEVEQNHPSWRDALESLQPGSNFKEGLNQIPPEKHAKPIEDSFSSPNNTHVKSQIEVSADLFIKNYKEYVIADKEDRTTLSQKEKFKQEIKTVSKDKNLMATIKERNLEVGKEVETLAKNYEKQHEQQRGFDFSR